MTTMKFYVKHSHVFPVVYTLKQVLVQVLFLAALLGTVDNQTWVSPTYLTCV